MIKIDIKPLSVNDAWRGRRFKTKQYEKYEKDVLFLLPKIKLPDPPFHVDYEFGFSSAGSDLDNPVKLCTDILQKKYDFNDSLIHSMSIRKFKVEKGKEYFKFEFKTLQ